MKSYCRYAFFATVLTVFNLACYAQTTIKGRIKDGADRKPITFATVFLNNTAAATRTADDGTFNLYNVKNGKYTLIVSCIGYAPMKQEVFVKGETIKLADIDLTLIARQLSEVKIRPKKELTNAQLKNYTRWFLHEFLGKTPNAMKCKLLNPEVLEFDFNSKTGKFTVSASSELVIENYALGYRIKYLLQGFLWDQTNGVINYTGFSHYEDLKGTDVQRKQWLVKRKMAYQGSQMHFFRSILTNQVELNEFYVFKLLRTAKEGRPGDSIISAKINQFTDAGGPEDSLKYWWGRYKSPKFDQVAGDRMLKVDDYVRITSERGVYEFKYDKPLLINYKYPDNGTRWGSSIVSFVGKQAYFDSNGVIMDPLDLMIEMYWQSKRVADTLPYDYELQQDGS